MANVAPGHNVQPSMMAAKMASRFRCSGSPPLPLARYLHGGLRLAELTTIVKLAPFTGALEDSGDFGQEIAAPGCELAKFGLGTIALQPVHRARNFG